MASGTGSARSSDVSPAVAVGLVGTFVLAGWAGFAWSGLSGAFFCALGATGAVGAAIALRRFRASDRTRMDALAPALTQLPAAQALGLMQALTETPGQDSPSNDTPFRSEVLAQLEALAEQTDADPAATVPALEALAKEHPRNPAVAEQLGRCALALGDEARGAAEASRALTLALDGGMNPMAARVYTTFEAQYDALNLSARHWRALARALSANGQSEASARCQKKCDALG